MAHNDNTINIFSSKAEMENFSHKQWDNSKVDMDFKHYRYSTALNDGVKNAPVKHSFKRAVIDDYNEAYVQRVENFKRYIEQFNAKHPERMSIEELRHNSLWLDHNHDGLNGYHGVDTSTKYCTLHLKNEKPFLYMGIELEITWDDETVDGYHGDRYDEYGDYDEWGSYDADGNYIPDMYEFDIYSIVREALKIGKGLFTAEEDGSLYRGYSAEFVSRPLSSQAWHSPQIKQILKNFTDYLKSTGALVNQPEENGFHIHVSKKFFSANPACNRNQVEVAKDMNWVFQKFQEEVETIGGRVYNTWCASAKMNIRSSIGRSYGIVIDKAHIEKDSLDVPYGEHSRAFIDSRSGETFEARVFHSTLDVEQILACIEFMRNISHGARENALDGKTFGQITRFKDAPNLQAVIKRVKAEKKKLYLGKKNTKQLTISVA